jgi:hypothetical protein
MLVVFQKTCWRLTLGRGYPSTHVLIVVILHASVGDAPEMGGA